MPGFKPGIIVIELLLQEGETTFESKTHGRPRLQALVEAVRARLVD